MAQGFINEQQIPIPVPINMGGSGRTTAGNSVASPSCGTVTGGPSSLTPVTNLSVTITTLGGPVQLKLEADGTTNNSYLIASGNNLDLAFFRGSTQLSMQIGAGNSAGNYGYPTSGVSFTDYPPAGTYTYSVQYLCSGGTASINYARLVATEI